MSATAACPRLPAHLLDPVSPTPPLVHPTRPPLFRSRRGSNRALRVRGKVVREWEEEWWKQLGREASDAGAKGDQAKLYEILRDLIGRNDRRRRDGGIAEHKKGVKK